MLPDHAAPGAWRVARARPHLLRLQRQRDAVGQRAATRRQRGGAPVESQEAPVAPEGGLGGGIQTIVPPVGENWGDEMRRLASGGPT
jgi:hypothetical protein